MLTQPWRFDFLGSVVLHHGDDVHDRFRERKLITLLAILALNSGRRLTRDAVIDQLWPEEAPDVSRNRFRVTLYNLRRVLEPLGIESGSILQAGRSDICLCVDAYTCDVLEMASELARATSLSEPIERIPHFERAIELYRGELLPGFDGDWIEIERDRLSQEYFRALRGISRDLTLIGNSERALGFATLAAAAEPYNEEVHCEVMRLYADSGNLTQAVRQYEKLRSLLAHDLAAEPSAATQKLAALLQSRLGHGSVSVKTSVDSLLIESQVTVRKSLASPKPLASTPREPELSALLSQSALPEVAVVTTRTQTRALLPVHLTRFFGRDREMETLLEQLAPCSSRRLVTVMGPGGVGKTRIAVESAARLQSTYNGRTYFVALADIFAERQIGDAILAALHIPASDRSDSLSQALAALNTEPSLLILDNMEHLLPESRELVHRIIEAAPAVHCLVTSRRPVGIEGECEFVLRPLTLPDDSLDPAQMRTSPSVQLFVDRSRAARVDFTLNERNASDVLWLCRRLEGLPLALELAAARMRVMSVQEMRSDLGAELDWLVDVRGGKETRHRSLRTAIEWSDRLLRPRLRSCFHALSVFAGGVTAEAVAGVCPDLVSSTSEVRYMLEELCANSLIVAQETANGRMRFGMLDSLRVFGMEQLQRDGRAQAIRQRHLEYFAEFAASMPTDEPELVADLAAEDANMLAALEYGFSEETTPEDRLIAVRMAGDLADYWLARGLLSEGRACLERALALDSPEPARSDARLGAAKIALQQGDYPAAADLAAEGISRSRGIGDRRTEAASLMTMGMVKFRKADYPGARVELDLALEISTAIDSCSLRAECLTGLGLVAWYQADHAQARVHFEEALQIHRVRGSRRGIADCLLRLGNLIRDLGDLSGGEPLIEEALNEYLKLGAVAPIASAIHDLGLIALFGGQTELARSRFQEAHDMFERIGVRQGLASSTHNIGSILIEQQEWEQGAAMMRKSVDLYRQLGDGRGIANCLHALSLVAEAAGNMDEALSLMDEALEIDRKIGSPYGVSTRLERIGHLRLVRNEIPKAHERLAESLAMNMRLTNASELRRTLASCAILIHREGLPGDAVRLAGAAASNSSIDELFSVSERRTIAGMLGDLDSSRRSRELKQLWIDGGKMLLANAAAEMSTLLQAAPTKIQ